MWFVCVRMHLATYLCTVYAHKLVVGPADESSHYKIMDENHPWKIDIHGWFLVVCDIIIAHDG